VGYDMMYIFSISQAQLVVFLGVHILSIV